MRRGRKPLPPAEVVDATINEAAVARAGVAANVVDHGVRDAAERFLDGREYERTAFVQEARFFIGHGDMAYFQAGQRLIVIREREPHGDFLIILEQQLGLNERTAQRLMQTAARLNKPTLAPHAEKLLRLGQSKVVELLAEDDETLAAFAEGGTVAGLTFDKYDAMSVREARRTLRDQESTLKAKDKLIGEKNKKIDDLSEKLELLASAKPDEREQEQLKLLAEAMEKADNALVSAVRIAAGAVQKAATGMVELQAQQSINVLMQRFVDACINDGFGIDMAAEVDPMWLMEWKKQAAAGLDIEATKRATRKALGRGASS